MKYYIGIDGGGTKTDCVITDENLNILHKCSGGPSSFLILGTETVSENILHLINECKTKLKIDYTDISAIVLGTAGAGRRSDAERLEKAFNEYCASQLVEIKNFHVESDARVTLEGAFSGKPGSILIAGTGSIIFGKDAAGNIHRAGGFGRYIGDEGSGYSIGRKGLTAAAKSFDGRGGDTILTQLISDKFGITKQDELIIEVYRNNFDIASAAPLVFAAAEQNDPAAVKIIEEEVNELILHITAMAGKINAQVLQVCLTGSIITHDNIFSRTFLAKIKDSFTNVNIRQPEHPPAIGAVLIGREFYN
ncbi:MAG: BadF/BadG/BcrA/BcrD ATPase family protein [Ignavibacteriaceae bacterium]